MRVTQVTDRLVLVERRLLPDRYVELSRNGVWADAKHGRAVCPITVAAIERVTKERS